MAIGDPVVGTIATVDTAATQITVSFPRTGAVAGDVYVAWVTVAAATVPDLPAGWVAGGVSSTSGGSLPSERIMLKVATGSEPASQVFTHASGTSRGQMLRFSGVDNADPVAGGSSTNSATATSSYVLPAIAGLPAGCALVAVATANAPGGTWTPPATQGGGWTEVAETTGAIPSTGVDYLIWSGSGSTGTVTMTRSSNVRGCSGMIALRPAGSGSTTYDAAGTSSVTSAASGVAAVVLVAAGLASAVSGATGSADVVPRAYDASGVAAVSSAATGSAGARFGASGSAAIVSTASGAASAGFRAAGTAPIVSAASGSASVLNGSQVYSASGTAAVTSGASGAAAARLGASGSASVTTATAGTTTTRLRAAGLAPVTSASVTAPALAVYVVGGTAALGSSSTGSAAVHVYVPPSTVEAIVGPPRPPSLLVGPPKPQPQVTTTPAPAYAGAANPPNISVGGS